MCWIIRKRMSSEQLSEWKSGWVLMHKRSQLGGRPGKKYSLPVLLAGVRSREEAMKGGRRARVRSVT